MGLFEGFLHPLLLWGTALASVPSDWATRSASAGFSMSPGMSTWRLPKRRL